MLLWLSSELPKIDIMLYLQKFVLVSGGGSTNTATFGGCTYNYSVTPDANLLFGADVMPDCNNTNAPPNSRPILFWFYTNGTGNPKLLATYCAPTISLFEVTAVVDINTGNLTSVQETQPFNFSMLPFVSLSQNVTGPPLNGQAFNGIVFDLTDADDSMLRTSNATNLQMPAAIFQAISKGPGGLTATFQTNNTFADMATKVYVST
jgi:hypothetical protein